MSEIVSVGLLFPFASPKGDVRFARVVSVNTEEDGKVTCVVEISDSNHVVLYHIKGPAEALDMGEPKSKRLRGMDEEEEEGLSADLKAEDTVVMKPRMNMSTGVATVRRWQYCQLYRWLRVRSGVPAAREHAISFLNHTQSLETMLDIVKMGIIRILPDNSTKDDVFGHVKRQVEQEPKDKRIDLDDFLWLVDPETNRKYPQEGFQMRQTMTMDSDQEYRPRDPNEEENQEEEDARIGAAARIFRSYLSLDYLVHVYNGSDAGVIAPLHFREMPSTIPDIPRDDSLEKRRKYIRIFNRVRRDIKVSDTRRINKVYEMKRDAEFLFSTQELKEFIKIEMMTVILTAPPLITRELHYQKMQDMIMAADRLGGRRGKPLDPLGCLNMARASADDIVANRVRAAIKFGEVVNMYNDVVSLVDPDMPDKRVGVDAKEKN